MTRAKGIKNSNQLERPPARLVPVAVVIATSIAVTAVAITSSIVVVIVCVGYDTQIVADLIPVVL